MIIENSVSVSISCMLVTLTPSYNPGHWHHPLFLDLIVILMTSDYGVFFFLGVKLTLSALVDGKNFNAGGHKVGLGFELEA